MDNFELDTIWLLENLSRLAGRPVEESEPSQNEIESFVERVSILCLDEPTEESARRLAFEYSGFTGRFKQ